ncbi:hypothetical protein Desku_0773 [Desulfofundulus kuznetsovii DSM 6115]|uniref:Uncharacterized protein n=1 Tax=Desulfofundulus kuznetsovii (strain DSM 6115 / VKM B-1805 / 17) TaxID=760568 RepID=A0AAU8PUC0_DESK7|nr:hypothetical protein Desku_0773 [Desulfofundulus kuznetsovii DSM 6115]
MEVLYGESEKGFLRWLVERGILPNQKVEIPGYLDGLVPAGVVMERGSVRTYTLTRESLEKVWSVYGPPRKKKEGGGAWFDRFTRSSKRDAAEEYPDDDNLAVEELAVGDEEDGYGYEEAV